MFFFAHQSVNSWSSRRAKPPSEAINNKWSKLQPRQPPQHANWLTRELMMIRSENSARSRYSIFKFLTLFLYKAILKIATGGSIGGNLEPHISSYAASILIYAETNESFGVARVIGI